MVGKEHTGSGAARPNASDLSAYKSPLGKKKPGSRTSQCTAEPEKASELFNALRAAAPGVIDEDIAHGPDWREVQRVYLQDKKQQRTVERLGRRAGTAAVASPSPVRPSSGGGERAAQLRPQGSAGKRDSVGVNERTSRDDGKGGHEQERKSLEQHKRNTVCEGGGSSRPASPAAAAVASAGAATVASTSAAATTAPAAADASPRPRQHVHAEAAGRPLGADRRRCSSDADVILTAPAAASPAAHAADAPAAPPASPPPAPPSPLPEPPVAAAAPPAATLSKPDSPPAASGGPAATAAAPADAAMQLLLDSQSMSRHPHLQAAYDSYMDQQYLSSLTDEDYFAATSVLAAVERAYPAASTLDSGPDADRESSGGGAEGRADDALPAAAAADAEPSGVERSVSSGVSARARDAAAGSERSWHGRDGGGGAAPSTPSCSGVEVTATGMGAYDAEGAAGRAVQLPPLPRAPSPDAPSAAAQQPLPPASAAMPRLALVEVQPLTDHRRGDSDLPSQRSHPAAGASAVDGAAAGGREGHGPGRGPGANDRTLTADSVGTYEDLGDLSQYSLMRQFTVRLCSNPDFEMVVTAIIFANCVTLCLYDPRKGDMEGLNGKIFWAELAFNIFFTIEVILRMISMGSAWAFIRRPWNQFDLFMVVTGYTAFVPGNSSAVNAIRALRALRPLRTITRFESLRGVIVCFLEAIPLLASVGGLLIFFVFLYAVAAVQLFPKTYHWTCLDSLAVPLDIGEDPDMFGCGGSGQCPANYTCTLLDRQNTVNVAGYDNTGLAMLSVWQALTLTGWVFMMYRTVDAYSLVAVIYYVTLVFIGAYFVLNLFLAVLKIKFAKAQTLFHNQLLLRRSKARRNSILTFMSKVQTKWTEYSTVRSKSTLLNSRLSSAISSRLGSSGGSLRMSAAQLELAGAEGAAQDASGAGGAKHQHHHRGGEGGGGRRGSGSGHPGPRGSGAVVEPATGPADRGMDGEGGAASSAGGGMRPGVENGPAPAAQAATAGHSGERPESAAPARPQARSALVDSKQRGESGAPKRARSMRGVSFRHVHRDSSGRRGGDPRDSEPGVLRADSRSVEGGSQHAPRRQGSRLGSGASNSGRPVAEALERPNNERWAGHATAPSSGYDGALLTCRYQAREITPASGGSGAVLPPAFPSAPAAYLAPSASRAWDARDALGTPRNSLSALMVGPSSPRPPRGSTLRTLQLLPYPGPVAEAVRFAGGGGGASGDSGDGGATARSDGPSSNLQGSAAASALPPGDLGPVPPHGASRGGAGEASGQAGRAASGQPASGEAASTEAARSGTGGAAGPAAAAEAEPMERQYSAAPSSMGATNVAMIVMSPAEFDEFVADHPYWERQMLRLQYRTRLLVNHNLFNQIFMLLIFVNTVLLALEYDNQPDSLTRFHTYSNYTLTGLFTAEMILKLYGLGFWDYIRDGFNIFDAMVVTVSLLEILLSSVGGLNAVRALRVLKAMRVLRLFKLFRYMQSLRRIGEVLLSAFTSFAAIATLLTLFWLVFSIVGMHVFGDKDLTVYPWPNFSTFMYSLVATWNVLNLENWQNTMYAVVRQTDYGSSLYFVLWIVIGRYIFLTLFLAVTLEAFEAKYDPNAVRMGAKGGLTSVISSFFSKSSGFTSSVRSSSGLGSSLHRANSSASSNNSSGSRRRSASLDLKRGDKDAKAASPRAREQSPDAAEAQHAPESRAGSVLLDRSVSRRGLRPGIGYLEDAKAAASAQYGDESSPYDEPRVNIKRMYTIKRWIDTGDMDVLKAAEASEPSPQWWQEGGLHSRANTCTVDGGGSVNGEVGPSPRRPQAARGPGTGSNDGRPAGARGGPRGMDDSAAQSPAASADGVAQPNGGASPTSRPRPVAEGLEPGAAGVVSPDPAAASPPSPQLVQQPNAGAGQGAGPGRSGGGSSCTSPLRPGTGAHGRGSPSPVLQSLTLQVRRSVQGFAQPAEIDGTHVDELLSTSGGVPCTGDVACTDAEPPAEAAPWGYRSSSLARSKESGGLILSRVYGRSVHLGAQGIVPRRSSVDLAPPVQVWAAAEARSSQPLMPAGQEGSGAAAAPLSPDPRQPASAPVPTFSSRGSPDLLRLMGIVGEDAGNEGSIPCAGGATTCATAQPPSSEPVFLPVAALSGGRAPDNTSGHAPPPRLSIDLSSDLLASFMESPLQAGALPTHGSHDGSRQSFGNDVVLATFQDMLALPSGHDAMRSSDGAPPDDLHEKEPGAGESGDGAVDIMSTWPEQAGVRWRRSSGINLSPRCQGGAESSRASVEVAGNAGAGANSFPPHQDDAHVSQAVQQPQSAQPTQPAEPPLPSLETGDSALVALADELAKSLLEQRSGETTARDGGGGLGVQGGLDRLGTSGSSSSGRTAEGAVVAPKSAPQPAGSWSDQGLLVGEPVGVGLGSGALASGPPTAQATPRKAADGGDSGDGALTQRPCGEDSASRKHAEVALAAAEQELAAAVKAALGGGGSEDGTLRAPVSHASRLQDSAHSMEGSVKPGRKSMSDSGRQVPKPTGCAATPTSPRIAAMASPEEKPQQLSRGTAQQSAVASRGSSVTDQRADRVDSGLFGELMSQRIPSAVWTAHASGGGKALPGAAGHERSSIGGRFRGAEFGSGGGDTGVPAALGSCTAAAAAASAFAADTGRGGSLVPAAGTVPGSRAGSVELRDGDTGTRGEKAAPLASIMESGTDIVLRADSCGSEASGASQGSGSEGEGGTERRKRHYKKRRRASILIEGTGKSFWIWDEDHPTRERAYWLVTHKRFEYFMFAFILLNCVALALESPYVESGSVLDKALVWSNVGFTILFAMEALLKMFAYTFVAYIKRITNQVDFLIVVSSLLEIVLISVSSDVAAVAALRVLRAIKPLRLLTRSAGMRLVFKSVTMSLMSMANVSIVCILFFLIFAILGVQLFAGRFYRCNDDTVPGKAECVGNFTDPFTNTTVPRTWENDFPNFDNTGNALLCCFITATLNGYTEIMVNAMSAPVEPGFQPRQFQNPGAFFWFFGFIVVCAFTLLNLYVGVIFSQFSKIRMLSETGSAFLTSDQNEWAELTKMVFRLKPPDKTQLPTGRLRRSCYHLVHSRSFDIFILVIILINVGFLAATWYGEPDTFTRQKDLANIVFTAFFAAEAVTKIFALGWAGYFKVAWNKLDFALLVLGVLDLILSMLHSNFLRILRIFRLQKLIALVRIARFAQLVKSVKGIQSLFTTLIYSLPAFGNVGALIGLFFFMYAYVGTFLFGEVQNGESLNHHVNFRNFFRSLLVLMRVATGDNWTGIMFDCMVQPPKCDRSAGECGSYLAIPYFLTFVLLISVILLNLFTAVIIETFEKTHEQEEWKLSPQALEDFVTLWSEYDDGSGTILPRHLEELLLRLDPPLGLGPYADNKDVLRFVYDLDIPLVNARVPFHKTAFELVKRCSQATMPEGAIKEQIDRLVDKFFHDLAHQDEMLNFSVAITVMKVQRQWRTRMRAAKLMRKKAWRQDRRDAPSYPDVVGNKIAIAEKYFAYKESQRESAKVWEASQQSYGRKPDKTELARRMEPRWRFDTKYAPPALVQATTGKAGFLELSKRAINVNKIVGLFRGGRLGGGSAGATGGGDPSVAGGSMTLLRSLTARMDRAPSPGGANPMASPRSPAPASPIPKLLRSITHTTGQLMFRTSFGGGVLGPASTSDLAAGARQAHSPAGAFSVSGAVGSPTPDGRDAVNLARAASRRLPTMSGANDEAGALMDMNRRGSPLPARPGLSQGAGSTSARVRGGGFVGDPLDGAASGELQGGTVPSQRPGSGAGDVCI